MLCNFMQFSADWLLLFIFDISNCRQSLVIGTFSGFLVLGYASSHFENWHLGKGRQIPNLPHEVAWSKPAIPKLSTLTFIYHCWLFVIVRLLAFRLNVGNPRLLGLTGYQKSARRLQHSALPEVGSWTFLSSIPSCFVGVPVPLYRYM